MLMGLVVVQMWNYWWGMSERQIDLIIIDQPLVTYPKTKDKNGKNGSEVPAPSRLKIAEAEMKWKQKYGNGQKPKLNLNLSDFTTANNITT